MAKGKRNNKRGRGGSIQNTTNDSDANLSSIAQDGSGDVRNHKGFSTGAFGTSDIDGSGLESELLPERSEMNGYEKNPSNFRREVHVPSRSRTSSLGADANEGFLNPADYPINAFGQHSQNSVRSRTSINNYEKAHHMSQDEFVLVPGSGGHDGHASVRSMRSQVSRQSANVALSSRDDILTEGDETGGDEMGEERMRGRLGSTASQLSRGSAMGGAVEVPVVNESESGFRSRRQSENGNEGWEMNQNTQNRRSQNSLKPSGWNEREPKEYVHLPSHHASRSSVHSRGVDGWEQAGVGLERDVIGAPGQLSRHACRISVMSHSSNVVDDGGFGESSEHGGRIPTHHQSRRSIASHRSEFTAENGHVVGSKFVQVEGFGPASQPHHASKLSVYSSVSRRGAVPLDDDEWREERDERDTHGKMANVPSRDDVRNEWEKNEEVFGGGRISHSSRQSMQSLAGGDAGTVPFLASRPQSRTSLLPHSADEYGFGTRETHHASRSTIHSHVHGEEEVSGRVPLHAIPPHSVVGSRASLYSETAGDRRLGSRVVSRHASRASIHSHLHDEGGEEFDERGRIMIAEEEGEGGRTSSTSIRSHLSCMACADDVKTEGMEDEKYGLPQIGDEIEVPADAVEEWGENEDEMGEEGERMRENREYEESRDEWRGEEVVVHGGYHMAIDANGGGEGQLRPEVGSRASLASHAGRVHPIGGRSHHTSRQSMRSNIGAFDENDGGGYGLECGSTAPIPAIRLSRASLNQPPTMDWNHNSMGSLNGEGEYADENKLHIPSHHASKMSLGCSKGDVKDHPIVQTAHSLNSLHHSHHSPPRDRRFSSGSTQDVAEWGERVKGEEEEEEVFDVDGGYDEYNGGMSRGTSHRSIYSTRSSKAGEQTEENLLQARINRSREPSIASLGDGPYIPPKEGWKSSAISMKSTIEEEGMNHSRRHSRRSSVHLVGTGIDLREEVVLPIDLPIPKHRSRSASIASRRSFEGVVFADQPELYSHPDDKFGGDKSIEGMPFRRTAEHEKTPQPGLKKASKVLRHSESEDELRALVSSRSASHTSVADNTPPNSAGFQTPRSRNSRESYLGTGEISMPSPSPFNQTQFQRDEYEAHKEREARTSMTRILPFSPFSQEKSEMATQTGDTIARAAGQAFALHYGASLSAKPSEGPSGEILPSERFSYSVGPPPPPSSYTRVHHHPMEEEERRGHTTIYDHGDAKEERGQNECMKWSSNSSTPFTHLPTHDTRYVEKHESRSMVSSSKTTTSSASSSTLKYATAASSYVDHLRPVQSCMATTDAAMKSMEMTTSTQDHQRQSRDESLFSPSKGTFAQKAAVFRQKEDAERNGTGTEETPIYKKYLQQNERREVMREVPIEIVRGQEIVVPPQKAKQQSKVVNVEMKNATSSMGVRSMQQTGYVHIERPKMNNSFERSNHPAAAVLNSMLSARANSSRSEDNSPLTRQPSNGGATNGGYLPSQSSGFVPPAPLSSSMKSMGGMPKGVMISPISGGYKRSIRPVGSEDVTFHYEMKHDLSSQQIEKRTIEEITKDEQSVLSRVGTRRADVSSRGGIHLRQSLRSREAQRAYNTYHEKKSTDTPSIPLTSAPKPFTPSSPYRSVALGQQQVYGELRAQVVPNAPLKKKPEGMESRRGVTTCEKEKGGEMGGGPIEHNKYTGSTIRRAIPQRGHIRNLAAAFDSVQMKADREVSLMEPQNESVQRRGSTTAATSSGRGVGGSMSSAVSSHVFSPRSEGRQENGGQDTVYRVPMHVQQTGTTTSGSTREEDYERMRSSGYNERSIHDWQAANEQQMRENAWSGRDQDEEELCLDSESDRPPSRHSGRTRGVPSHVLRTSTPLAGVKNDPRSLARALEKIPSIRGDDTLGRGRGAVREARTGGVRALASRFEKAAEEESEKARSASMTPRMRRREERRVEGEDTEDRREAAARRLSRGVGGVERLEREKEKRRSQSAHAASRKRRTSSTSDSGEEAMMREMEAVERIAREEIVKKEREEMRERKAMKITAKNEMRRPSEEERKIDEMFHGLLESQESHSAGERGTVASSRESVRTERQESQHVQHPLHMQHHQLQHQHYQYQQKYREHHQHHHYQSHLQSVVQESKGSHLQSIPSQSPQAVSHYMASHLHPIGANGGLEHGVSRRESTHTQHTTTQSSVATGLVHSPSVYREKGRALRGEVNGSMMMQLAENGRAATMGGMEHANMTASSPHFSPVNIRGPETAGQRVATYESRDGRNPVRVPSRQVRPYALATSTPMGTVQSSARGGTMEEVLPLEAVDDDSFLSTISGESRGSAVGRSPANQAEYKKQITRLQTVQSMEEEKISITSKALAHARKKHNPNNELAAQRTILLARLRVAALKRELQRLSALAIVRNPPPPMNKSVLGAMDISDITLHLNRNLCARPSDGGSCSFGFIVVLKCGVEVEATAPVCLLVPKRPAGVKVVHFPEHLRFSNLPVDFTIRLEVYVMKLREQKEESCTALLTTKARNLLGPGSRRAAITAGPGGSTGSGGSPSAVNGELPVGELVRCGNTALDRDSAGSMRLYLDAPEYPLEGTIELASRCSRLPCSVEVDLRGFLTMYKVVGGYGSWVRYWAVLRRGIINFWKYPDDEQLDRGGPVASADLSKCTDGEIVPASREICTRQFAFSIDMLVATTPSIVEKKRVLLAADTREQLKAWLNALNETLAAIRA